MNEQETAILSLFQEHIRLCNGGLPGLFNDGKLLQQIGFNLAVGEKTSARVDARINNGNTLLVAIAVSANPLLAAFCNLPSYAKTIEERVSLEGRIALCRSWPMTPSEGIADGWRVMILNGNIDSITSAMTVLSEIWGDLKCTLDPANRIDITGDSL